MFGHNISIYLDFDVPTRDVDVNTQKVNLPV